jgi:hypothetical protein
MRGNTRRCQAENPLIALSSFLEPALTRTFPNQQPGAPTYPFNILMWDVHHIYEGMTVLKPLNFPGGTQNGFSGRHIETIDWTGIGASDTVCMEHRHVRATYTEGCEPDKLVQSVEWENCEFFSGGQFGFQSTSIEAASLKNCYLPAGAVGGVKATKYDNCIFGGISGFAGPGFGLSFSVEVTNSRIFGMTAPFYGGSLVNNDGTNVTYANGTFTINKTALGGSPYDTWATMVPGQQLYLNAAAPLQFSGNAGMGYVISMAETSTNWIVNTTLPYATLPTWAVGNPVLIVRTGELNIRGCSGSKFAEQASKACKKGFFPWEYQDFKWAGQTWPISIAAPGSNAGSTQNSMGILSQMTINVIQASTSGNADKLTMTFTLFDNAAFTSLGTLSIVIDVTRAGKRVLTQAAFTGTGGADAFTLAGSPITTLPANGLVSNLSSWSANYSQTAYANNLMPTIEWENNFDCGAYQKLMINPDEVN